MDVCKQPYRLSADSIEARVTAEHKKDPLLPGTIALLRHLGGYEELPAIILGVADPVGDLIPL